MNKAEVIERIIDRITDPYNDTDEEIANFGGYVTLEEAKEYLDLAFEEDKASEVSPEDGGMPLEATPELYMEAYNCNVNRAKHAVVNRRLHEWLVDGEQWYVYEWYCTNVMNAVPTVVYTDWLTEEIDWPFEDCDDINMLGMIVVGMHSTKTFNPSHTFCWYDSEKKQLHSTNRPFKDGAISPELVDNIVDYIMDHPEDREGMVYAHMDNDDIDYVFLGGTM